MPACQLVHSCEMLAVCIDIEGMQNRACLVLFRGPIQAFLRLFYNIWHVTYSIATMAVATMDALCVLAAL